VRVVVCIPARYASTRFPGKVLAKDTGKYLIQHTYEQACRAKLPEKILIAADDEKIVAAAAEFDGACVLTRADHQSGTDRIAEAVQDLDADIVINVQGDEPEINPAHIDLLAQLLIDNPDCPMATLATGFATEEQVADPNVVKVILSAPARPVGATPCGCPPHAGQAQGPAPTRNESICPHNGPARAIYFSRSVIPYDRDRAGVGDVGHYLRHIGIYAYRKDFLQKITTLLQTPLEKLERLEQLRVIEHGFAILVGTVEHTSEGIDTPEQYAAFVKRCEAGALGKPKGRTSRT
jgi:3-deoxy-manno-octulosonate cytidylyltransferase (CMP-KDO synthetase)